MTQTRIWDRMVVVGLRAVEPGAHGERKVATVLFADVVGSTTLGEQLDVEPLHEIIGAFHHAAAEVIRACGGEADLSGDAVVGAFGVPEALEQHAGRALQAAQLILARVEELDRDFGTTMNVRLAVRIGVNTGDVLVTGPVTDLSSMAGDTWNVAARLQQLAGPGEIVVASRAASAAPGWHLEDLGPIQLEGRRQPVRGFRVLGERGERRDGSPPLVGRAELLKRISSLLREPEGPRLITLVGEAGAGKTRLVEELVRLETEPGTHRIVACVCPPFGGEGALNPLRPLLESRASATGTDRPIDGDEAEPPSILRQALGLLPPESRDVAPGAVRAEIRAAWAAHLENLSRSAPVIMVVEDLHWAEPELVDLLGSLAGRPLEAVRMITSARPDFLDDHHDWNRICPEGVIVLPALDWTSSIQLARWLVGHHGGSQDRIEELAGLAEGNPFFLTELVRSVAESGERDGRGRAAELPDTVQAVLAQRIDRLAPREKTVLQAASAVGRVFWPGAVAAALECSGDAVLDALGELGRRRFVMSDEPRAPATEACCYVDHALTMDVAYASIPRRRLHDIHDRIAAWVESSPSVSSAALLARHRLLAWRTAPADWTIDEADRERHRRDAHRSVMAAARQALAQASLAAARRWGSEALELASGDGQRVDALEVMGNAHFHAYEGDEAWAALTEAIDLAVDVGCRSPAEIAALCARALDSPIRWPGGMRVLPSVETLVRYMDLGFRSLPAGPGPERVRLLTLRGFWPYAAAARVGGESPIADAQSLESAQEAADMAADLDRPDLESAALDGWASIHITAGEYDRGVEVTLRRTALVDRIDSAWERGDICAVTAWTLHHVGRYREAEDWATRGIEWTVGEYPMVALHCLNWRGVTRFRLGEWDGLMEDLEQAMSLLGDSGDRPPPYVGPLFAAGAAARDRRGDREAADELMSILSALHSAADVGDRDASPLARWAEYVGPLVAQRGNAGESLAMIDATRWRRASRLGHLMSARCEVIGDAGRWELAPDQIDVTLRCARSHGLLAVEASGRLLTGRLALAQGDGDKAVSQLRMAESRFAEIESAWELMTARRCLSEALSCAGDTKGAAAAAFEAEQTSRELGVGGAP